MLPASVRSQWVRHALTYMRANIGEKINLDRAGYRLRHA